MKLNDWINIIKQIPSGRFFRLTYMTEMRVKPEYKKEAIKIYKITTTTTRTGIHYGHIKGVESKYPEGEYTPKKPTSWEWILKNKLKYNSNTKKHYLQVAPIHKGSNTKTSYMIIKNGKAILTENKNNIEDYIVERSYSASGGKIINIALEHILQIS